MKQEHLLMLCLCFKCLGTAVGFEILSPSSIAGEYYSPVSNYDYYLYRYANSTNNITDLVKTVMKVDDDDFCEEWTGNTDMITRDDIIVVTTPYNCFAADTVTHAQNAGVKNLMIVGTGHEVTLWSTTIRAEFYPNDMVIVFVQRSTFNAIMSVHEDIRLLLTVVPNPYDKVRDSPALTVFSVFYDVCSLVCIILATHRLVLYFRYAIHSIGYFRLSVIHIVLSTQIASHTCYAVWVATDPMNLRGVLLLQAYEALYSIATCFLYTSMISYQFYWLDATGSYSQNKSRFLRHSSMKKAFSCALFLLFVTQIWVAVGNTLPPLRDSARANITTSIIIIYAITQVFIMSISLFNGFRVYLLVRRSKAISSVRAKKISTRLITFAFGVSLIIIASMITIFYENEWTYLITGYIAQAGIVAASLAMILSFAVSLETTPSANSEDVSKLQTIADSV